MTSNGRRVRFNQAFEMTDLGGEQDGVEEADLHLARSPGGGNRFPVSLP